MIKKILLILNLSLGYIYNLDACRCYEPNSIIDEFNSSSLVIYGEIKNIEMVSFVESIRDEKREFIINRLIDENMNVFLEAKPVLKIEIEIINQFKGKSVEKGIIYTTRHGSSCGYLHFEIGEKFIVYGDENNLLIPFMNLSKEEEENLHRLKEYWTNQCRRTKEYNDFEYMQLDEICRKLENY